MARKENFTDREIEIIRAALEFLADDIDEFNDELRHGAYVYPGLSAKEPKRQEIFDLMEILKD